MLVFETMMVRWIGNVEIKVLYNPAFMGKIENTQEEASGNTIALVLLTKKLIIFEDALSYYCVVKSMEA